MSQSNVSDGKLDMTPTLPRELAELLEKVAKETQWNGPLQCDGFHRGVHWLHAHLLSQAGELNAAEMKHAEHEFVSSYVTINNKPLERPDVLGYCFVKGMQHQHQQSAARVALAESQRDYIGKNIHDQWEDAAAKADARIAELEAEVEGLLQSLAALRIREGNK